MALHPDCNCETAPGALPVRLLPQRVLLDQREPARLQELSQALARGAKYRDLSTEVWKRGLLKVKALAESP